MMVTAYVALQAFGEALDHFLEPLEFVVNRHVLAKTGNQQQASVYLSK